MQFCLIITHMLNDQPSLFEELIWGAYVCVCVCVGVFVGEKWALMEAPLYLLKESRS